MTELMRQWMKMGQILERHWPRMREAIAADLRVHALEKYRLAGRKAPRELSDPSGSLHDLWSALGVKYAGDATVNRMLWRVTNAKLAHHI